MFKDRNLYFAEITDTYGGESNYTWVRRYLVKAASIRGAVQKLSRETGHSFTKKYGDSEGARYDAKGACICAFVKLNDSEKLYYPKIEEL
jgi:hypothetical protein